MRRTATSRSTIKSDPPNHSCIWSINFAGSENWKIAWVINTNCLTSIGPIHTKKMVKIIITMKVVRSRDWGNCPCSRARAMRRSVGSSSFSWELSPDSANLDPTHNQSMDKAYTLDSITPQNQCEPGPRLRICYGRVFLRVAIFASVVSNSWAVKDALSFANWEEAIGFPVASDNDIQR